MTRARSARRLLCLAGSVASMALGLFACGGGAAPGVASLAGSRSGGAGASASAGTKASAYETAVAYAHCMRAHGVGNWPNPQKDGGFLVEGSGSSNPSHNPSFRSATKTCAHLEHSGAGGTGSSPPDPAFAAAALRYSHCMRAHGILNFPDPPAGGGLNLGGNENIDHNTPQFKRAITVCQKALPGGGPPAQP